LRSDEWDIEMTKSFLSENIHAATAVIESLAGLQQQVESASRLIVAALKSGHKILACGNGGSSAAAAHMTTEFVCRFEKDRRPYPAICLSAHGGDLTAISNDYAFEEVFSRQVEAFAQPGDVLVVFSTSGKSENVYRSLQMAKRLGIETVALLGRDGDQCAGMVAVELLVPGESTARIQEAHQFLLHVICELVERGLATHP
jgi:D-sedoheptulose 7-phosphate isomerase